MRSKNTGAVVVCGVDLATAREERARLCAEAKAVNPETRQPTGMQDGEVTVYEVTTREGLVI